MSAAAVATAAGGKESCSALVSSPSRIAAGLGPGFTGTRELIKVGTRLLSEYPTAEAGLIALYLVPEESDGVDKVGGERHRGLASAMFAQVRVCSVHASPPTKRRSALTKRGGGRPGVSVEGGASETHVPLQGSCGRVEETGHCRSQPLTSKHAHLCIFYRVDRSHGSLPSTE